ncbi:MAG: phosphatase PAP2 family protein [Burkholderiales bacterium]|nr:phosphatase PAP2 family protein [Burkholderiales bacterium]PZM99635.1 MAG: phosphatase PAP2 family protein [Pseudomonadota bacterium]
MQRRLPSQVENFALLPRLRAWECGVILALNRHAQTPFWKNVYAMTSRLGDGGLWAALALALVLTGGQAGIDCVRHMLFAGTMALAVYALSKRCTGRQRPCVELRGLNLCVQPLDRYSFPSGHTLHAVVFTTVVLAYFPQLAPALVPFVLLTALSRIALGLHYPSDVLGGAAIGAAVAALSFTFG